MTHPAHHIRVLRRMIEESERAAGRMRGFARLETNPNRRAGFITDAKSYEANASAGRKELEGDG